MVLLLAGLTVSSIAAEEAAVPVGTSMVEYLQSLTPEQRARLQQNPQFLQQLTAEQRQSLLSMGVVSANDTTAGSLPYEQVHYQATSGVTQMVGAKDGTVSRKSYIGGQLPGNVQGMQGNYQGMQGNYQGMQGNYQGMQGNYQSMQGNYQGMQGNYQGMQGNYQGMQGNYQGMQGNYQGMQGNYQGMQGNYQGMQNGQDPGLSSTEQYFKQLAGEEKAPRGQVLQSPLNLKQFGFDFFGNSQGFSADDSGLVGSDYVLGPGDTLRVDLWGNIEGHYQAQLDRNGEIVLPKIGVIGLVGQSFAEAKKTIDHQIGKYFKHYQLNVALDSVRSINVFLVGEVKAPGTYRVSSLSTVLTLLSSAGGPNKNGSLRNIQVLRHGHLLASIDFYDFFRRGDSSQDIRLQSGDTVLVPIAAAQVGIAGGVRRPAIYELKPGETLGQLIELAGGVVSTAYLQNVRLQRVVEHNNRSIVDLSLHGSQDETSAALATPLQDRDLVQISPITDAGGFVSLSGYVARPGEYQLEPGMRLADLLTNYGNLLPEYFPDTAQLVRKSPPAYRPEILTVNLQQALKGDKQNNVLLQEYDQIRLFSRMEMEELPEVNISGAVLRPGTYRLLENMTIADLVAMAGSLKRGAYLDLAELTRYVSTGETTNVERFDINLGAALNNVADSNLQLKPHDHLIVRSIPDYDDRYVVTLKGAVRFPGSYAIGKGETLSSVLERAGGFTDKAYLRGAVFSREALKETQQKQIDKLIAEEQKQLSRIAEEISIGAMSVEESKSAETLLENRKTLIEDLKNTPPTGRLVVKLAEMDKLKGSPQDIMLMDRDELVIPENFQTINVQGEVYNSTSLSWVPGKTVSYYLGKVGGAKETANDDEIFIVRADGTVVSKQQGGHGIGWDKENWRWTFGGFNNTVLYPGDSILVPEKYKQYDWLKETKDISTIIYQMALGAAAVASF